MKNKYWVARDLSGALFLTNNKPKRCDFEYGMWISEGKNMMRVDGFPNLTWKDEPLEVKLQPVITDLDIKAQECTNKVIDNEDVKNIIIDIETLGRRNDAAITQVGVAIADKNFNIIDTCLIQIDPQAWHTCTRTFTGETLLWWINQKNTPVSKKVTRTAYNYEELIKQLNYIFSLYNTDNSIVWTKGTMDLFCIKDLYEFFNMETPWKFWQPRDIRTAKEIIKDWKTIEGSTHNALDDAIIQLAELKINIKTTK